MKPITPHLIAKLKVKPRRTPITLQNLATTGLHCYVTLTDPKPALTPTPEKSTLTP
jgi:hypothetical protein